MWPPFVSAQLARPKSLNKPGVKCAENAPWAELPGLSLGIVGLSCEQGEHLRR